MQVRLVIVGGRASKNEVPLELPAIIGRSPTASLTIPHPLVSRQHCMLFAADGIVMLRDLGSLNGTYFGTNRITEMSLRPGDCFTIGPLAFRCDYEAAADIPPAPPPQETSHDVVATENASPWAGVVHPEGGNVPPVINPNPASSDAEEDELFRFLSDDPPA